MRRNARRRCSGWTTTWRRASDMPHAGRHDGRRPRGAQQACRRTARARPCFDAGRRGRRSSGLKRPAGRRPYQPGFGGQPPRLDTGAEGERPVAGYYFTSDVHGVLLAPVMDGAAAGRADQVHQLGTATAQHRHAPLGRLLQFHHRGRRGAPRRTGQHYANRRWPCSAAGGLPCSLAGGTRAGKRGRRRPPRSRPPAGRRRRGRRGWAKRLAPGLLAIDLRVTPGSGKHAGRDLGFLDGKVRQARLARSGRDRLAAVEASRAVGLRAVSSAWPSRRG